MFPNGAARAKGLNIVDEDEGCGILECDRVGDLTDEPGSFLVD